MLSAVQIKPDVYAVGAIDWNAREFHGYTTEQGITYNAYLILDEKITLIDTVKYTMTDELIERIQSIIDPGSILNTDPSQVPDVNPLAQKQGGSSPTPEEVRQYADGVVDPALKK